jgi:hypothetical protein
VQPSRRSALPTSCSKARACSLSLKDALQGLGEQIVALARKAEELVEAKQKLAAPAAV